MITLTVLILAATLNGQVWEVPLVATDTSWSMPKMKVPKIKKPKKREGWQPSPFKRLGW